MKFSRLVAFVIVGLALQVNVARAESAENPGNAKKNDNNQNVPAAEVWGDPEENEESESVWTWFGMGYELRNLRNSSPSIAPDITDAEGQDPGRPKQKSK